MRALDLFAGTGWGVACQWLGIEEFGVDNWQPVIDTRAANGMETVFRSVWDGLNDETLVPDHDILIASPPCQTFTMAGSGKGRLALDHVLRLIDERAFLHLDGLREFALEHGDERTALVLTPMAYVERFLPRYVLFEQVPPVLPVWEGCADVLRLMGYSVWTGNLHAEQYGVPQTRRRAVLIARYDGLDAIPPTPTHSKFYARDPLRLDPDVLPWVSMAQALGWGMTERPYPSVTAGTDAGGTDPAALGGSGARKLVYAERSRGAWNPSGDADNDGGILRLAAEEAATIQSYPMAPVVAAGTLEDAGWIYGRPSPTVVGTFRPDIVAAPGYRKAGDGPRQNAAGSVLVTHEQAARLQSYPDGFRWVGSKGQKFQQIGNAVPPLLAKAVLEAVL